MALDPKHNPVEPYSICCSIVIAAIVFRVFLQLDSTQVGILIIYLSLQLKNALLFCGFACSGLWTLLLYSDIRRANLLPSSLYYLLSLPSISKAGFSLFWIFAEQNVLMYSLHNYCQIWGQLKYILFQSCTLDDSAICFKNSFLPDFPGLVFCNRSPPWECSCFFLL